MKLTNTVLRYFRSAPYPIKQPKNANRRTDCGENLQSIKFANYLKEKTMTGKCDYVWTKIAHETSSKSYAFGNLMRNMGKNAGVPDFIFTNGENFLWLELKNGKDKKLSADQQFFKCWCEETNSPYCLAYSAQEAIKIVEVLGICKV